jgi:hypothetical protein
VDSLEWKQTQKITEQWPASNGIVQVNMQQDVSGGAVENFVVTNLYPNPVNKGSIFIYQKTGGAALFIKTQQMSNSIDIFSSFPSLAVSVYDTTLAISGFPGMTTNSSSATNIYTSYQDKATGFFVYKFDYEMSAVLSTPTLGKNGFLATFTHNGIDLYKKNTATGKFALVDSFSSPRKVAEYRGTSSLQMDPSASFLVRGLGQYDYSTDTGCAVYSISKDTKVSEAFDSFGSKELTYRCLAGGDVFGMSIWISTTAFISLNLYSNAQ